MRNGRPAIHDVHDLLSRDPVWAAYAIADLRPDLASHCRWLVAPDGTGLALLYQGLAPPILLTAGTPEGVASALSSTDLPPELFLSVLPSHLPAVHQHYQHVSPQEMVRMVLPQDRQVPAPAHQAARLSSTDERRLRDLYRHGGEYAPDSFESGQLEDGFFFGIEDDAGTLVAAGGTHVAFRSECPPPQGNGSNHSEAGSVVDRIIAGGVAAIGNIYTRPDLRGRGFGSAVTSRVAQALQVDGFGVIVLNVDEQNLVARSIYEKLGFVTHCRFLEGFACMNRETEPRN